ncbi:hypothetical protein CP985_03240 [Malaciobacter mytili LMG 24559]|uniref:Uncharacterized protein n=1 Tax=Malaciobacter mytili LMG 24559 TaxID=1032238 RepID=A0AAX2AKA0_9BACT|nr:hypothetical protein [Malaciobacter mytili]AXH16374.1 hypothetical protein AMYT_a0074 [Malaciobacter mytili LMG 24559]RXK16438.1 hypothetical protein CP985_03240 [Malaciobacter mytili LMG 24559]
MKKFSLTLFFVFLFSTNSFAASINEVKKDIMLDIYNAKKCNLANMGNDFEEFYSSNLQSQDFKFLLNLKIQSINKINSMADTIYNSYIVELNSQCENGINPINIENYMNKELLK